MEEKKSFSETLLINVFQKHACFSGEEIIPAQSTLIHSAGIIRSSYKTCLFEEKLILAYKKSYTFAQHN